VAHKVTEAEIMEEEKAMKDAAASEEKPRPQARRKVRGK